MSSARRGAAGKDPEKEEHPMTSQRILDAARSLFALQGFHATTINDISKKAQVNRALIFYYFESKENLYRETVNQAHHNFIERMKRIKEEETDLRVQLQRLLEIYIERFSDRPDLMRIILREVVGSVGTCLPLAEIVQGTMAPIKEILAMGVAQGVFRPLDQELAAMSLMGAVDFVICHALFTGAKVPDRRRMGHILDIFLDGIMAPVSDQLPEHSESAGKRPGKKT